MGMGRGKKTKDAQRADDAQGRHDDRQERRHQRAKNQKQNDESDRQRDQFAFAQRFGRGQIQIQKERRAAGDPRLVGAGKRELGHVGAQVGHDFFRFAIGGRLDRHKSGVPVAPRPVLDHHVAVGHVVHRRIGPDRLEQVFPGRIGIGRRKSLGVPDDGGRESQGRGKIFHHVDADVFRRRPLHAAQRALDAAGKLMASGVKTVAMRHPEQQAEPGAAARIMALDGQAVPTRAPGRSRSRKAGSKGVASPQLGDLILLLRPSSVFFLYPFPRKGAVAP